MRSPRLALLVALLSFGCGPKEDNLDVLSTRPVTLPDGSQIRAEVMIKPDEVARGMMFRDGRGLLFIHTKPAAYRYWMFNVKVPPQATWKWMRHWPASATCRSRTWVLQN